jgi:hypothetical protein
VATVSVTLEDGSVHEVLDVTFVQGDAIHIHEYVDGVWDGLDYVAEVTADGHFRVTPADPAATSFVSRECYEGKGGLTECVKTLEKPDGSLSYILYVEK